MYRQIYLLISGSLLSLLEEGGGGWGSGGGAQDWHGRSHYQVNITLIYLKSYVRLAGFESEINQPACRVGRGGGVGGEG